MEIANSKQSVSVSALTEQAGQFLVNNPSAFDDLKNFFTPQNGLKIFTDFLKNFDAGIIFELANLIGIDDVISECQRRVTAGDGIWLRDKDTAAEDLRKLVVDYKIVAESQKFGRDGKSLNACIHSWVDYCRFNLKIPADMLCEYYPTLKNFFAILKEMVTRGEIPQSQREKFLNMLVENAQAINTAIFDLMSIFHEKFPYQLNGLTENEISEIQNELPHTTFTDSHGRFIQNLSTLAKKRKDYQLNNALSNLWREVAGNKFPDEWSKFYRTPIFAMVPASELATAQKVFETVMSNQPHENDVRFAIDYLNKRLSYFDAIKKGVNVEESFTKAVIGEYQVLMVANDEIRNELELHFQGSAYQWYPNVRAGKIVEEFARNKYYNGGAFNKVTEKVEKMSDQDAKKLLIKLLDKNFEVGLKILRDY